MVAYKFYWHDDGEGPQLFGVLPERRTNPKRITTESVMNWVKSAIGEGLKADKVFFTPVEIRKEDLTRWHLDR